MLRRQVMLHYAKTGTGQQVATIPWISSDFTSFTSPVGYNLRDQWWDSFGNCFVLKKGSGTINRGDVLAAQAVSAQTLTGTSTVRVVNTTSSLTANAEVGNFFIDQTLGESAVQTDVLKLIKANSGAAGASTITVSLVDTKVSNQQNDADAYTTAPANTDTAAIIRPDTVVVFPTASITFDVPVGIAVQSITTATWGFAQIRGIALVHAKGDVTAWVANKPVVPDGTTAGYAKGAATVQITATGANVGQALQASAAAAATQALGVVNLVLEQYA